MHALFNGIIDRLLHVWPIRTSSHQALRSLLFPIVKTRVLDMSLSEINGFSSGLMYSLNML